MFLSNCNKVLDFFEMYSVLSYFDTWKILHLFHLIYFIYLGHSQSWWMSVFLLQMFNSGILCQKYGHWHLRVNSYATIAMSWNVCHFFLESKDKFQTQVEIFEVKAFVLKLRWRTNSCLCFSDQSVQEGGNCKPSSVKQSNQVQGHRHSQGVSVCIAGCFVNVCKLRREILLASVSLSFSAK